MIYIQTDHQAKLQKAIVDLASELKSEKSDVNIASVTTRQLVSRKSLRGKHAENSWFLITFATENILCIKDMFMINYN